MRTMTPLTLYHQDLKKECFSFDPAQEAVVNELQRLFDELVNNNKKGFIQRLITSQSTPKGVYIWGTVGRGKTYLVNTFYQSLPFENKLRLHYYRFMKLVHDELKRFQGEKDPLSLVAKDFAKKARVIILDEFFVSDIADAMILANLLKFMFEKNITLVTTSNIQPDGLYKDGLQRARFLPAIKLLKTQMTVLGVTGETDYRLRTLEQLPIYYTPLNAKTCRQMNECFEQLTQGHKVDQSPILEIEGRNIPAVRIADGVSWFTFTALCDGPRSQNDYIALAKEFHTIFLDNIPVMGEYDQDKIRRFISLVDELYDRGVNLIIAAEAPMDKIHKGKRLTFEYKRTLSRLQEMQSKAYLSKEHCP